ncbi:MAG TPA: hypothetical protein VLK88_02715 [Gemmatimonadales bacterium]|nr:hypothetical protein [Gemmatimonadales bacterium]
MIGRFIMLGAVILLAGCHGSAAGPSAGQLQAKWAGSDSGKLIAKARATWCAPGRLLEVIGVDSDAGLGLAIYPSDSVSDGDFPVMDPRQDSLQRPRTAVGMRWFTETQIKGYQGDSGGLKLTRRQRLLDGALEAKLHAAGTPETIRVSASFRGVPLVTDSARCRSDSVTAEPDDSAPED